MQQHKTRFMGKCTNTGKILTILHNRGYKSIRKSFTFISVTPFAKKTTKSSKKYNIYANIIPINIATHT